MSRRLNKPELRAERQQGKLPMPSPEQAAAMRRQMQQMTAKPNVRLYIVEILATGEKFYSPSVLSPDEIAQAEAAGAVAVENIICQPGFVEVHLDESRSLMYWNAVCRATAFRGKLTTVTSTGGLVLPN